MSGYDVFNPLEYGEKIFDGCENAPWYAYMEALLPKLRECDCIYMLDGWEESYGSVIEYLFASRCDITVIGNKHPLNTRIAYKQQEGLF